MRQLVYTMFISNNRPSFYLWWKENLAKHRKVSKYCETDCSCFCDRLKGDQMHPQGTLFLFYWHLCWSLYAVASLSVTYTIQDLLLTLSTLPFVFALYCSDLLSCCFRTSSLSRAFVFFVFGMALFFKCFFFVYYNDLFYVCHWLFSVTHSLYGCPAPIY